MLWDVRNSISSFLKQVGVLVGRWFLRFSLIFFPTARVPHYSHSRVFCLFRDNELGVAYLPLEER